MTPRMIARQLSMPSGILGRLVQHLMNRNNAKMNAFAIRQLGVEPSDRILEVGFGGGVTLPHLIDKAGFVAGVDRSPDVVHRAKSKFSRPVAGGRAAFHQGSVEALPFYASSFEKAITVNTVYFWNSLEQGFREIHRVLVQGGCLVIGFLPKEFMDRMGMPADIFTSRTTEEITMAATRAGFNDVRLAETEPGTAWVIVVASSLRSGPYPGEGPVHDRAKATSILL